MSNEGVIRLSETLGWSGATRNDEAVASALMSRETPKGVYTLDASTIADEFFLWIESLHLLDGIRVLEGQGIQRCSIDFEILIMLYVLRVLCCVKSMNDLPNVLFADRALMLRLGFNAQQVDQGLTQRGANRKGERINKPLDPEMLSKNGTDHFAVQIVAEPGERLKPSLQTSSFDLVCSCAFRRWEFHASVQRIFVPETYQF